MLEATRGVVHCSRLKAQFPLVTEGEAHLLSCNHKSIQGELLRPGEEPTPTGSDCRARQLVLGQATLAGSVGYVSM